MQTEGQSMSESVFSQMLPIIDSSIVDLMVTLKSDNPHKSERLKKLSWARENMIDVIRLMDEIYPKGNFCENDEVTPLKCVCSERQDCENRLLKRQRIEGEVVLAGDEQDAPKRIGLQFGKVIVLNKFVPRGKVHPPFEVACHKLRTSICGKDFVAFLEQIGAPFSDCRDDCAECSLVKPHV